MSELKEIGIRWEENGELHFSHVYLKSEADKVIAEKDKEIADLIEKNKRLANKDIIMASETIKDLFKELRHHKHKRCLAMAKWCRMHDEFIQLESERIGLPQSTLFLEYRRKAMWWNKWRKRWLELAEKFKDKEAK